jgi:hypothetical protein
MMVDYQVVFKLRANGEYWFSVTISSLNHSAACLQLHPYGFKSSITVHAVIHQSDRVLKYAF